MEERSSPVPSTWYLSPDRASPEALVAQAALAAASPVVDALLRSCCIATALINDQRQVVALNACYLEAVGTADAAGVLGLRPGESLGCLEAEAGPGGCGTARACAGCGAAAAIVASAARQQPEERDCVVTVLRGGARVDLDLRVTAAPLDLGGRPFTLVALRDVSAERRRSALERVFFHELTSAVVSLAGACDGLDDPDPAAARAAAEEVRRLAHGLSREVLLQRALASGRAGGYRVTVERVPVAALAEQLRRAFQHHAAAAGKALRVSLPGPDVALDTDAFLVQRLVTHMLANAFEATAAGGEVRLEIEEAPGAVLLRTWNAGAIPPALAPHVFQRYFSTKPGDGRGQGTYALKLFGETYLEGKVGFTSTTEGGTTFELRLPRSLRQPAPAWSRGELRT